jgi:hypothetical protein
LYDGLPGETTALVPLLESDSVTLAFLLESDIFGEIQSDAFFLARQS